MVMGRPAWAAQSRRPLPISYLDSPSSFAFDRTATPTRIEFLNGYALIAEPSIQVRHFLYFVRFTLTKSQARTSALTFEASARESELAHPVLAFEHPRPER